MQITLRINLEFVTVPTKEQLDRALDRAERVLEQELEETLDENLYPNVSTTIECPISLLEREGFSKKYIDSQQAVLDAE